MTEEITNNETVINSTPESTGLETLDKIDNASDEEKEAFLTGKPVAKVPESEETPKEPDEKKELEKEEKPDEKVEEVKTELTDDDVLDALLDNKSETIKKALEKIGVRNAETLKDALDNYVKGDRTFSETRQLHSRLEGVLKDRFPKIKTLGDLADVLEDSSSGGSDGKPVIKDNSDNGDTPKTSNFDSWLDGIEKQHTDNDVKAKADFEERQRLFNNDEIAEYEVGKYNPQLPAFQRQKEFEVAKNKAIMADVHEVIGGLNAKNEAVFKGMGYAFQEMKMPGYWDALPDETKQTYEPFREKITEFLFGEEGAELLFPGFSDKNPKANPYLAGITAFVMQNEDALKALRNRSDIKGNEKADKILANAQSRFTPGSKTIKDSGIPKKGEGKSPGKKGTPEQHKVFQEDVLDSMERLLKE